MENEAIDMARGSSLSDEELKELGVSRKTDEYGRRFYEVPCVVCGRPVGLRTFSTEKIVKCSFCKKEIAKKRKAKVDAAREELLSILANDLGTDYDHLKRFEKGTSKFGAAYSEDIEIARKAIGKFDSVPEVIACIELIHIGARVIAQQKVGDFTVDFCLPDEKVVIEIDGSLYHKDEAKKQLRDNAVTHMLGVGWMVRHIPSDAVVKKPEAFGRTMRRMLNARREDLGMKPLTKK